MLVIHSNNLLKNDKIIRTITLINPVFVSATRRRRDIKIPLCLSALVQESLI